MRELPPQKTDVERIASNLSSMSSHARKQNKTKNKKIKVSVILKRRLYHLKHPLSLFSGKITISPFRALLLVKCSSAETLHTVLYCTNKNAFIIFNFKSVCTLILTADRLYSELRDSYRFKL